MSFIGNSFTNQTFVPQVDYFNGNASTTQFTLSRNVASVFDVQVVIENVPQNPSSAFTVNGKIITFTSAPPSGTNNIYVRYTSPTTQVIKPAQGTVGPTEINSSYSLWNLSGATINYTAGNVGIGTASPTNTLQVTGGISSTSSAPAFQASAAIMDVSAGVARFNATGADNVTHGTMTFNTGSANAGLFTERMRITSTGNVGIGVAPTVKLDIDGSNYNTATSTTLKITDHGNNAAVNSIQGTLQFRGRYWSGDDNTAVETRICSLKGNDDGSTGSALGFYTQPNGGGGSTERVRVTSSGGTRFACENIANIPSSSNWGVEINNTGSGSRFYGQGTGTETQIEFGNRNGTRGSIQTTSGGTSYNTTSDYRLKENIAPMTGALTKVSLLKPVTYNWKINGSNGQGFIAHELQAVIPDCVTGEKDAVDENNEPKYQMVDTSFLVATLTAAIKEQQAIIENLKSRIEVLEAK